jgi:osmotically-inducible protein OsmY
MKTNLLTALVLIAACPAVGFASGDTDHKIAEAAKDSYNYRTVLEGKVHVKVDNGVVTLTGKVQDSGQRDLAEDTVSNLPGVVSVDNEITVLPDSPEHSDAGIAFKIRSTLLM